MVPIASEDKCFIIIIIINYKLNRTSEPSGKPICKNHCYVLYRDEWRRIVIAAMTHAGLLDLPQTL